MPDLPTFQPQFANSSIPSPSLAHAPWIPLRAVMRCGKAECACATDPDARHVPTTASPAALGPHHLTPGFAEQAKLVRTQVDAGHQFRKQVEAFWAPASSGRCPTRHRPAASQPEAPKRGSKKPSTRKSSTK